MPRVRTSAISIALVLTGTLAGFFLTYAFTIMPALATTDDRTFVAAFQGLERMFGNVEYGFNWPVFLGFFVGPLVIAGATTLNRRRPIVWWLVAGRGTSSAAQPPWERSSA